MLKCSSYASQPFNYAALDGLLRRAFERIVYISLNYDLILDRALATRHGFHQMSDYIAHHRQALIKPHGSVNWGQIITEVDGAPIGQTGAPSLFSPAGPITLDPKIHVMPMATEVGELRRIQIGSHTVAAYPALSVPLGPHAKTLSCPPEHLEWLQEQWAAEPDGVDLLAVGFSANDEDVLDLMREADAEVRSALCVAGHYELAADALRRMGQGLGFELDAQHQVLAGGFELGVRSGDLATWTRMVADERGWSFFEATRAALGVL